MNGTPSIVPLIDRTSLARTVDAVNEALDRAQHLKLAQRRAIGRFLASRQGQTHAYADSFAPLPEDRHGIRLFTGEPVRSDAGTRHVLGQETCRVLRLLKLKDSSIVEALGRAEEGLAKRVAGAESHARQRGRPFHGRYCCGRCSCALWRNLAAGGLPGLDRERWFHAAAEGLRVTRRQRGWQAMPFYYALLALTEMPVERFGSELKHAACPCEALLRRDPKEDDIYDDRRRRIARRVLRYAG